MKKIFIIGFFLVCSFILGYIFNSNNDNYERYKIYMHPNIRADQYLLDTKTGIIWQLVQDEKKQNMWEPMLKFPADELGIENWANEYLNKKEEK